MLTTEPAGVSGQQAYLSNVLLQNKPARKANSEKLKRYLFHNKKAVDDRFWFKSKWHNFSTSCHIPFCMMTQYQMNEVSSSLYLEGAAHFRSFWHSLLYTGPTSDKSPLRLSHWPSQTVSTFTKQYFRKPFLLALGYFKSHPYVSDFSLKRTLLILHFYQTNLWQIEKQQADQNHYVSCPIHHCGLVLPYWKDWEEEGEQNKFDCWKRTS